LLIDEANSLPLDDKQLNGFAPYVWQPEKISLSRFGAYVDRLAKGGFFAQRSKVGLLRYDRDIDLRTRDEVIRPALTRHGLKLDQDFAFTPAQSVSDLSGTAAQANNAVLRFRQAGIDRVLFLPSALVIDTIFPPAAESQGYRPRYGLDSAEGPASWTDNAQPEQLNGALAIGWNVRLDLGQEYVNDGNKLWSYCRDYMRKHGAPEAGAYGCGGFFFLQEALARAPEVNAAGVRAGADRLGSTPWTVSNYGSAVQAGRFDRAGATVLYRYDAGCNCFKASSGPEVLP
jgi:hypothetical protein